MTCTIVFFDLRLLSLTFQTPACLNYVIHCFIWESHDVLEHFKNKLRYFSSLMFRIASALIHLHTWCLLSCPFPDSESELPFQYFLDTFCCLRYLLSRQAPYLQSRRCFHHFNASFVGFIVACLILRFRLRVGVAWYCACWRSPFVSYECNAMRYAAD